MAEHVSLALNMLCILVVSSVGRLEIRMRKRLLTQLFTVTSYFFYEAIGSNFDSDSVCGQQLNGLESDHLIAAGVRKTTIRVNIAMV